jgi:hypothetical protein
MKNIQEEIKVVENISIFIPQEPKNKINISDTALSFLKNIGTKGQMFGSQLMIFGLLLPRKSMRNIGGYRFRRDQT